MLPRTLLPVLLALAVLLAGSATAARTTPARATPLARSVSRAMSPQQRALFAAEDRRVAAGLAEVERKRAAALARGIHPSAWTQPPSHTSSLAPQQDRPGGVTGAISRGRVASRGQFPYMASLSVYGSHSCGASLIRKNVLLTAAHCLFDSNAAWRWHDAVKMGGVDLRFDNTRRSVRYQETRFPVRMIVHPGYNASSTSNMEHDIALIQLDRPVNTTLLRPISMAPASLKLRPGQTVFTAGWGLTEAGVVSDVLLFTTLPMVGRAECTKREREFPAGHLCAGGAGGADSCQGDSGGPLAIDGRLDTQVGIVSYGYGVGCGENPRTLGYYTSVMDHRSWIEETLKKHRL